MPQLFIISHLKFTSAGANVSILLAERIESPDDVALWSSIRHRCIACRSNRLHVEGVAAGHFQWHDPQVEVCNFFKLPIGHP